jgi:poly(hydroxyalkanoate) depolymerase family esterase
VNSLPYRDIVAALRLTRTGDLVQATAALQRALGHSAVVDVASNSDRQSDLATASRSESALGLTGRGKAGYISQPRGRHAISRPPLETEPNRFLGRSFTNAAGTLAYKLFIPKAYRGQPCPLIVMLHGCTQTVEDFATGTGMNDLADELTFFVAYPQQPTSANPSKCWNWFSPANQQRDHGEPSLVAGITRAITHDYAIDSKRMYIAGMSAGAAAAAQIAAAYPDVYAAVGVHSGLTCRIAHDVPSAFAAMKSGERQGPVSERLATPNPPVPTIVFHGDRDATVHPRNGDRFVENQAAMQCEKEVRKGRIPGGLEFTQTSYTDQGGKRIFEQWAVHGAGHAWSGGNASGSYTEPRGPDASREMLRFFLAHHH